MSKKALIIVDPQYDFMPGGALAVPRGDEIIPEINYVAPMFDFKAVTQDWHPADHCSFASQHKAEVGAVVQLPNGCLQKVWPDHCVQGTHGAEIHKGLFMSFEAVIGKGKRQDVDSYSGFFDNANKHQTALDAILRDNEVKEVFICGLATEYCVKFTALDAARMGYKTNLLLPACRGIHPKMTEIALGEMSAAGVVIIRRPNLNH